MSTTRERAEKLVRYLAQTDIKEKLNEWELEFLKSVWQWMRKAGENEPSDKQMAKLEQLYEKFI